MKSSDQSTIYPIKSNDNATDSSRTGEEDINITHDYINRSDKLNGVANPSNAVDPAQQGLKNIQLVDPLDSTLHIKKYTKQQIKSIASDDNYNEPLVKVSRTANPHNNKHIVSTYIDDMN